MENRELTKLEQLLWLNQWLLADMPRYKEQAKGIPRKEEAQWQLFRSLVNVREPKPVSREFMEIQDSLLQKETAQKGVTDISDLVPVRDNLYLWQGDITTLRVDAIVNAANSGMTGCYHPCHGCIDNVIHTFAGVQLRLECAEIMERQGHAEPAGRAKMTDAYNLPCDYIIHTVGPIISGRLEEEDCSLLASCYRSCLEAAREKGLQSIAFCCISTGEFHFPNRKAAEIAIKTVKEYLAGFRDMSVVFNVFKDTDLEIYRQLLGG